MMAGIQGIRASGGASKGEKGEVGMKGKLFVTLQTMLLVCAGYILNFGMQDLNFNKIPIIPRR